MLIVTFNKDTAPCGCRYITSSGVITAPCPDHPEHRAKEVPGSFPGSIRIEIQPKPSLEQLG